MRDTFAYLLIAIGVTILAAFLVDAVWAGLGATLAALSDNGR